MRIHPDVAETTAAELVDEHTNTAGDVLTEEKAGEEYWVDSERNDGEPEYEYTKLGNSWSSDPHETNWNEDGTRVPDDAAAWSTADPDAQEQGTATAWNEDGLGMPDDAAAWSTAAPDAQEEGTAAAWREDTPNDGYNDWVESLDEGGTIYWYNEATRESRYDFEGDITAEIASGNGGACEDTDAPGNPSESERYSEVAQNIGCNEPGLKPSGEVEVAKPIVFEAKEGGISLSEAHYAFEANGWSQGFSDEGHEYWANNTTGEKRW